MDWTNELFVRLYVRDTADWKCLPWQARALFPLLLRRVDRAGVLETRNEVKGVAALVDLPVEVVAPGLAALLEDGAVIQHARGYLLPNFIEAQEANKSDKARAKEYRDKRRAKALVDVTPRDADVTPRDSRVTPHHAASHGVTLRIEETRQEEARRGEGAGRGALAAGPAAAQPKSPPGRKKPKPSDPTPEERASIAAILGKLNERSGREYRTSTVMHARRILRLLRSGHTERDLRLVVWDRANEWADDPKMGQYLRPSTLFGPEKFDEYLASARAADAALDKVNGHKPSVLPDHEFRLHLLGDGGGK